MHAIAPYAASGLSLVALSHGVADRNSWGTRSGSKWFRSLALGCLIVKRPFASMPALCPRFDPMIRRIVVAALAVSPISAMAQGMPQRLNGAELLSALPDHSIESFQTSRPNARDNPTKFVPSGMGANIIFRFRADGSYTRHCKLKSGADCDRSGGRDTGIWRIERDSWCMEGLWYGNAVSNRCYAVFRTAADKVRFEQIGEGFGLPPVEWTLK